MYVYVRVPFGALLRARRRVDPRGRASRCLALLVGNLECLRVARDSIALKPPTPSMDADGVGPVEMATHIVRSIRLQLTHWQPTHGVHGPYLRTALKCKRPGHFRVKHRVYQLTPDVRALRLGTTICPIGNLNTSRCHHSSADRRQSWWNPA